MSQRQPVVAFTVDLEPDCPPFLRGYRGMEQGLPPLLDLLGRLEIPATFFATGEVAAWFPRAIERVVSEGHELGCHGMTHTAFTSLDPAAAREEIVVSAEILRAFGPVTSFRAPYLRFPEAYVEMLEQSAFELDSSQALYKADYYGWGSTAGGSRTSSIRRVPASVTSSVLRLPRVMRRAYLGALSNPVVLFVHPWEFVDLRRERLRIDCRFRTGDIALRCVAEILESYMRRGARFARMRDLTGAKRSARAS